MSVKIGPLFLVVGPSGVGKDTLIDGAAFALSQDPRFVFPARHITRPKEAGGEAHDEIDRAQFLLAEAKGVYALSWTAHGLHYGIPASIQATLDQGYGVIVNVSRAVLDVARARFPRRTIISILAPNEVIRARLLARGRETADDIEARIARAAAYHVLGDDVVELVNDGDKYAGVAKFIAILEAGMTK